MTTINLTFEIEHLFILLIALIFLFSRKNSKPIIVENNDSDSESEYDVEKLHAKFPTLCKLILNNTDKLLDTTFVNNNTFDDLWQNYFKISAFDEYTDDDILHVVLFHLHTCDYYKNVYHFVNKYKLDRSGLKHKLLAEEFEELRSEEICFEELFCSEESSEEQSSKD